MRNLKVFVSVRDRWQSTKICIESLLNHSNDLIDIYIFDNGSLPELNQLMQLYCKWIRTGRVNVICNNAKTLENVYWGKAFSWCQFLNMMKTFPNRDDLYLVMMDNDVRVQQGWIDPLMKCFSSKILQDKNVKVISCWNGCPRYDDIEVLPGSTRIAIRDAVGSPFLCAPYTYWVQLQTPPFGLNDAVPDDVFYWNQLKSRGEFFGVLLNRKCTDITPATGGSNYSARLKYNGDSYPND